MVSKGRRRCSGMDSSHALALGYGCPDMAAAVHSFSKKGIDPVIGQGIRYCHHHVIGFGNRNAQLIGFHGLDVLSVSLHHGHGQTRSPDVIKSHCGSIGNPQAHTLTRPGRNGRAVPAGWLWL